MFLKGNHNGYIKVCECANGRKHPETIKKEDTDSSTVAIESVYITAIVGAH